VLAPPNSLPIGPAVCARWAWLGVCACVVGLLGVAAPAAGCDHQPPPPDDGIEDATRTHGIPDVAWPDTGPPTADLAGTWATVEVTTATLGVLGAAASTNEITTLLRMEVTQDGDTLDVEQEVCSIDLVNSVGTGGEGTLVTTIIPPAYIASLEPSRRPGQVREDGAGGWRVTLPRHEEVRGVTWDGAEDAPLPTSPDDPRVVDQDGDGHPGLTIQLKGSLLNGLLFVVERDWTALDGRVAAADRIEGRVTWGSEQAILGALPPSLASTSPTSAPDPDPDHSVFVMRRAPAGATCAELVTQRQNLFPWRAPPGRPSR